MEKNKRREREFNTRRAAILLEAEKNFSDRGYHNVTVAEIANASGFSTGALYQYFESKEHLYASMIFEKLTMMYDAIERKVKAAGNLQDKLLALIGAQLQFVEANADFCRIFLRGENELSPQTMNAIHQRLRDDYFNHLSFIESILKAGIKNGMLRNLPSHEIAAALSHLIRAASIDWMIMPSKDSLVAKKEIILDIFLNGVKKT
ncbi:MAG: TetR/AcrR family transcriptional regulator [Deltaproteobacteria bacterium]